VSLDLVVLAADKDQEFALKGLLDGPPKAGIRQICYKLLTHPQRDPGCFRHSHEILRPYASSARFAIVVLDVDGSGCHTQERAALEAQVESRLAANGWNDRAVCVAILPEVETWIWSQSPRLPQILGWRDRDLSMADWLSEKGYLESGQVKPADPKSALKAVLRQVQKPASSSIFREIAQSISYTTCQDPAFQKLLHTLRDWFPAE